MLARIPEVARPRRFIPSGTRDEESSFLEAIQFLRLNVQRTRSDGQGVVVAVTSPLTGDGKTMVVAWLAQSLAFNEAEVVAVDCDLRSPMLHTYFDARDELGGALPNLRLVSVGDEAALPVALTGRALREMFDDLRDKADYVIVDTSPVASVAHASAVAAVGRRGDPGHRPRAHPAQGPAGRQGAARQRAGKGHRHRAQPRRG